ncbi:unnamed protein product [Rotaria sp. Silwood2]|nr:unnamed protein product [Rotaria sp. Silwood2]
MHHLRRIKYFHIPCKERLNLAYFYDEEFICICDYDLREANCFPFSHSRNYTCEGLNPCENQGRYFFDDSKCSTLSLCVCDHCSYGSRCQFSTKDFSISLDAILGYQIQPNLPFIQQRLAVKMYISITTFMLAFGLLSNICSILTFQTKTSRKFIACVGIERAFITLTSKSIKKTKHKRIIEWVTITICIFIILCRLQDAFHRKLIDDEEEHRTWCMGDLDHFL